MLDSLYGNLLGTDVGPALPSKADLAPSAQVEAEKSASSSPAAAGDDMFADIAPKHSPSDDTAGSVAASISSVGPAPAPAPSDKVAAAGAPGAQPQAQASPKAATAAEAPSKGALPQSFSAAKLMMPPVRKKAEPVATKRPMMPSLDLQKLQEEKEALLRQRASAAEKKDEVSKVPATGAPTAGGLGTETASTDEGGASAVQPAAGTTSSLLYGDPDEEYDPAKPNDYDEFVRRRMRLKAEEEMERRRQESQSRQQANKAPEQPKADDFATKMMKKMGWKEGSGLGKDGQGMAAPLVMKKTDARAGVITEGQRRNEAPPQPQQASGQPPAKQARTEEVKRPPTKVLLLNNLVGAGEVDEDLEGETAEEASKYGKLKKCVVREIKGVPDAEAVRIFLEFERVEDATKALVDMNGRYFGGRVVKARFFDEARFERKDLDRRDDD